MATVFITGGTGYIGKRLTRRLLDRGHQVFGLVRKGSENRLPEGAHPVVADPFNAATFAADIVPGSVYVQLLGVSHPSPKKARQFREIDLVSVKASADAAAKAGVSKFIYISVAMTPSRFMHAYQEVRAEGEDYCLSKHLSSSFIRPWYVLGPGHYWPMLLLPVYGVAELVPSWRKKARSIGLVTIRQMIRTLTATVEAPPVPKEVITVRGIRTFR